MHYNHVGFVSGMQEWYKNKSISTMHKIHKIKIYDYL